MKKITILDTTLRDGSYAVNYSFTSADTAIICHELEEAGFDFIEIGHGVGLNGSNLGYGKAAATDEEYMAAAKGSLKKAKWGMFCIPGIAQIENIDVAARYGMNFIRVGTNITEVKRSEPFIRKSKEKGMFVAANYMKSYALPPEDFAKNVKLSEEYGADMVYIVDSAGGMFPDDIKKYFQAIRQVSNIPVGFHGHNNLDLAVANSLEAIAFGVEFIDASLQGLGRSAGNTPTECLVAALLKRGHSLNINLLKVLGVGQKFIQPLLTKKGIMPLDLIAGYADFHSSYMHYIQKYSAKYNVNPAILIIELCKIDKINVNEEILDSIAQQIKTNESLYLGEYGFFSYFGEEQDKIQ